ncbi:MAG: hypothetical protein AAF645_01640, partial [Myxococcota bacterium]
MQARSRLATLRPWGFGGAALLLLGCGQIAFDAEIQPDDAGDIRDATNGARGGDAERTTDGRADAPDSNPSDVDAARTDGPRDAGEVGIEPDGGTADAGDSGLDAGDSGFDAGETDPCDAPAPSLIIVSPEEGQDFPGPSGRTVPVRWAYTGTATEFEVVMTYERAEPPVMARVSREAGCFSSWSTPSLEAET